jgi:predicted transposase YbfD/YdcC
MYVLSLKGNQGRLCNDVGLYLDSLLANHLKEVKRSEHTTIEKGHGRIEHRHYLITESIDWLEQRSEWKGLRSIGVVEATRTIEGKDTVERHYYIASIAAEAKEFAHAVRNHWGIEN